MDVQISAFHLFTPQGDDSWRVFVARCCYHGGSSTIFFINALKLITTHDGHGGGGTRSPYCDANFRAIRKFLFGLT
jgi:hypothetical protein